jgi:hypothetical protein
MSCRAPSIGVQEPVPYRTQGTGVVVRALWVRDT